MGISRYKIYEPHFLTCTVLHWLPIFTNKESVQIVLDSFRHLQESDNMTIFSYVILENHLHLVASSDDISKSMQKFKSYSVYKLLELLKKQNATTLLKQFAFHKKAHKTHTTYQLWEEGFHLKLIQSEKKSRWFVGGREVMVMAYSNMRPKAGAWGRGKIIKKKEKKCHQ